jgi:hypothetical protein
MAALGCWSGLRVAVDPGIPEQLVAGHGLELIIGHESSSLGGLPRPGRAQARPASRPSSWSAWSWPAGISAITDPLRKGPEDRWAGGWVSRGSQGKPAVRMALA